MKLNIRFVENAQAIKTNITESKQAFNASFGEIQKITEYIGGGLYAGDYIVTPKITEQTLPTKEKLLLEDMTVKAIPFFNVGNNSGGTTVYIGNEV
jgi:hypothetical protein